MSKLRLIHHPPCGGAWNMAVDEALLQAAQFADATLRIYRWAVPTLSLGYFQRWEDRGLHPPSLSCRVVRRPSGGGAILHDRELTYALILPAGCPWMRQTVDIYFSVHRALVRTLERWGCKAEILADDARPAVQAEGRISSTASAEVSPAEQAAEFSGAEAVVGCSAHAPGCGSRATNQQPFMCFARRSCGDVVVGAYKIAGSAQKRGKSGVLQHGSILLSRSPFAPEFPGIYDLLGRELPRDQFVADFVHELGIELNLRPVPGTLTQDELRLAQELFVNKYGNPRWTIKSVADEPTVAVPRLCD